MWHKYKQQIPTFWEAGATKIFAIFAGIFDNKKNCVHISTLPWKGRRPLAHFFTGRRRNLQCNILESSFEESTFENERGLKFTGLQLWSRCKVFTKNKRKATPALWGVGVALLGEPGEHQVFPTTTGQFRESVLKKCADLGTVGDVTPRAASHRISAKSLPFLNVKEEK